MQCQVDFPVISTADYLLASVGVSFVVALAVKILIRIGQDINLFVYSRYHPPDLKQYGKWAVVTGATDGIGKSYARQLAQRGINVILISRNLDKLLSTSLELQDEYGVKVEIIQADFSEGWRLYGIIREKLKDKKVGILVNNVGTSEETPRRFLCTQESNFVKMINVNINSALIMTAIVLPQMLLKKKGAVVTVSSLAATFVTPFTACYGATKAASDALSASLYYEYKSSGITFQSLIPSFVNTKMISFTDMWNSFGPFVPDAEAYCKSAIVTVGATRLTTGYWLHELYHLSPEWLSQFIICFYWDNIKAIKKTV